MCGVELCTLGACGALVGGASLYSAPSTRRSFVDISTFARDRKAKRRAFLEDAAEVFAIRASRLVFSLLSSATNVAN